MQGCSQLLGGLEVHIIGSVGMSHKIKTKSTMHKGQMLWEGSQDSKIQLWTTHNCKFWFGNFDILKLCYDDMLCVPRKCK